MGNYSVIGKSRPQLGSKAKATGDTKYASDIALPGMLQGKILRSPYPHARILNIDTSRAERLLGVKAVITGKDITDIPHSVCRAKPAPAFFQDKFALAKEKVRFIGDDVAAVAAIDEDIAMAALDLIKVEYEELPAVFDPLEAMKPDAPRVHDHAENNISAVVGFELGSVERGFAESDLILEDDFVTQYVCHSPMETHAAVADFSPGGDVTLWLSTQAPFFDRTLIAEAMGIPVSKVRVIKPPVGGGFGGKFDTNTLFPAAALLSMKAGRPVKIIHTREEELVTTSRRHPSKATMKMGVKKDGRIVAADSRFVDNGGAYMSCGMISLYLHGAFNAGPYKIDNFKYAGLRIYTNSPFCGAQRGHGGLQGRFVMESLLDMLAEKLDLDPREIRRNNTLKVGDTTATLDRVKSCGHVECIDKATEEIGWKDKWRRLPDGKGVGISSLYFASGAAPSFFFDNPPSLSGVKINAEEDGAFTVFTGSTDIGQGSETTIAMIAAEELGVGFDKIRIIAADTAITPVDMGTYSSRVTVFAGNAAKNAARQMKEKLLETAAGALEANIGDLEAREDYIAVKGNPQKRISVAQVVTAYFKDKQAPLTAEGHYNPPIDAPIQWDKGTGTATPTFVYGADTAEVEIDKETGILKVKKIVAAHDCGFAINPMAAEGQTEGCVYMGFGQATTEEFVMEKGWSLTNSFLDYKMPTAADMPQVKPLTVESLDPEGPFGAKEAGEGAIVATIPSIANAVYDAIGVRIKTLPITPEKILRALEEKEKGGNS